MRSQWYGDERDLLKWTAAVECAEQAGAEAIMQVAFLCDSKWPSYARNGELLPPHPAVRKHFRTVEAAREIGRDMGIETQVLCEPFAQATRAAYVAHVASMLGQDRRKKVVLLDPDTGLAPQGRYGAEHVTADEVTQLWESLCPQDWLLLYQHARRTTTWRSDVRSLFAAALGGVPTEEFSGDKLDVVIFAARR